MLRRNITPMTQKQANKILLWYLRQKSDNQTQNTYGVFVDHTQTLKTKKGNPYAQVSIHFDKAKLESIMITTSFNYDTIVFNFNHMIKYSLI